MTHRHLAVFSAALVLTLASMACGTPEQPVPVEPPVEPAAAAPSNDPIQSAMSAGPESISADATVMDWEMTVIREGTNGWTCLPDRPDTEGLDPWCVNDPWLDFLKAYIGKTEPTYTGIGFAYMLIGDSPVSNSDPYATEETSPDDWVTHLGAHLMMLVPDLNMLEGISTDHMNGGPWVMWPNTPYAHLMIPVDSR